MIQDFKDFIMKGNVLDLAVAVVLGAAFGAVVTSLVDNILNPIAAAIFGEPSFDAVTITLRKATDTVAATEMFVGSFITDIINFLIIAFSIFMVVKAFEKMQERRGAVEEEADDGPSEVDLLAEIRDQLAAR